MLPMMLSYWEAGRRDPGSADGGGNALRRSLLLAALSMVISLVLAPAAMAQNTLNCGDFASQPDAQANLQANPSDPNNLDADDDGLACEEYPYPGLEPLPEGSPPLPPGETLQPADNGTTDDQYAVEDASEEPVATADASALPDTGGVPLVPVAASGAALLLVGGGLPLIRR